MCKGDSERPPSMTHVEPFVVEDEKSRTEYYDKKVITNAVERARRWLPQPPNRYNAERVPPIRTEGRDMPDWTEYANPRFMKPAGRHPPGTIINYRGDRWMAITGHGVYKNVTTEDVKYLSTVIERECLVSRDAVATPPIPEEEKEEPSYRDQYVSPEIHDLRNRVKFQLAVEREQTLRIDRLESDVATLKKRLSLVWKLCFIVNCVIIGGAVGFAIYRAVLAFITYLGST